jgi:hypothetical protein
VKNGDVGLHAHNARPTTVAWNCGIVIIDSEVLWSPYPHGSGPTRHQHFLNREDVIENCITSADLLNPSDALDLLAEVAGRCDDDNNGRNISHGDGDDQPASETQPIYGSPAEPEVISYPPISTGSLSQAEALQLVQL